nr:MAG TPA: hypothetical protein [Bacteriophage sp.]
MKYYAFMPFYHWSEIMDEKQDDEFILGNVVITDNSTEALVLYAETPCPASQLIEADNLDTLHFKINQMVQNFKDESWLKEYIYSCI